MQQILKRALYVLLPAVILCCAFLGLYALALTGGADTVSFAFLIGFPMIAGAVIYYFKPKNQLNTLWGSILWLGGITLGAVALSFVSGLEGMACIAMAVGPILFGVMLGGLFMVVALRWRDKSHGTLKAVVAPIMLLVALGYAKAPQTTYTISNTIIIQAAPADVYAMLQNIPDIAPSEVPTLPSHWLGIPKPTAAVWEETSSGAVRHSYWGDGIHFRENITAVIPDKHIAWDFSFPENWIVDGIQDPHITVGSPYFDVLSGSYTLAATDTGTQLTLTTRTYDGSELGAYAKFWHHFFFDDFHEAILTVVKNRVEAL